MAEAESIQLLLSGVAIPLLSYIIAELRATKREVNLVAQRVQEQNSRIGKLEQWTKDHELLDQERTSTLANRLEQLQVFMPQRNGG